jgi:cytochrome c peroxidase
LNGIWATAPYLHNGSVPTLTELLKKSGDRKATFHVGGLEFDPVNVGFVEDMTKPLFDTSVTGNSNKGHEYGVDLSHQEKKALIEYLKSL